MQFKSVFIAVLGFMAVLFSCKKTSTEKLDEMISAESMLKSVVVSREMDQKK